MKAIRTAIGSVEDVLMFFAAASFIAIMLIMSADVLFRYLFSSPLAWAFEVLTRYLMPAAFFFAVSYTLRRGEHLVVEIFHSMMPIKARSFLLGLLYIVATAIIAVICWMSIGTTLGSWRGGEQFVGAINWPVWTSHLIVATGTAVLTLRAVEITISLFIASATGVEPIRSSHAEEEAI